MMDTEDTPMATSPPERTIRDLQVDNVIRAIQQKKPVQDIDFTIHTMEDGTQVSTLERVCKGMPTSHGILSAPFSSARALT
jgi:serine/threonine-protein phosphatase 2B catalytic subunit